MSLYTLLTAFAVLQPSGSTAQGPERLHEGFLVNRVEDQIVLRWHYPGRQEARFGLLACSLKDNRIATELSPGLVAVWDPERDLVPVFLQASPKGLQALAFSTDGALLATADAEHRLAFWDAKTGKKQKEFNLADAKYQGQALSLQLKIKGLVFTPDGKSILVAYNRIRAYDLATGNVVGRYHRLTFTGLNSAAVSPDGRYLAVGGSRNVHLIDMAKGEELPLEGSHAAAIGAVAFSDDGRWLASGGADRQIVLWDVKERKATRSLKDAHVEAISALVFTRDGKRLLSGNGPRRKPDTAGVESGYNSDVKVWDVARGTQVDVLVGHPTFGIQALGMTGDGRTAVSAGANNDKTLRLWDLAALDAPPRPFGGGKARAKGLDLTRDGQWLITHPGHKQLVFWDARTGKLLKQIETAVSLHSFVVSADKKYLYGQSIQRSIVKIDLETGKIMMSIPTGDYVPGEIVLSPDGRLMAAGSAGAQVRVIDLQTDQVLFQLKGGLDSKVHSVKFTPGSDRIAAGSSSPLIRLWDAVKGSVAHEVKLPSPPKVMTLSPDGKSVLVGFNAWPLRLFDVKRGEEIRRYEGPTLGTAVLSLAYSPDGKRILAGGPNLTLEKSRRSLVDCLHLIDVDSGRILGRWKSEPGAITNLRFSIDGNQAYYVSGGILRVLSLKEGF